MSETLIQEIGPETYPDVEKYRGRCLGCEKETEYTHQTESAALNYMKGYFQQHVLTTGHRVAVEKITPALPPIGSEDCKAP